MEHDFQGPKKYVSYFQLGGPVQFSAGIDKSCMLFIIVTAINDIKSVNASMQA